MDQFMEWLISTPSILLGVSLVIFVITLIMVFRRLSTFLMTIILLGILYGSGYVMWNYEEVSQSLTDYYNEPAQEENGMINSKASKTLNLIKNAVQDSVDYIKDSLDQNSEQ